MPDTPLLALIDALRGAHFAMSDTVRRTQASALDVFGLGPHECDFQVIASGARWRLRHRVAQLGVVVPGERERDEDVRQGARHDRVLAR